ncbi:MAG: UDP-3-O-(3-hydroxymyristoyl)glucosamine N-acyltransferase [Verrucomicrobiales bacterium]|nr:UDP-3-O-(3-hydroxymyristoyl)glucosamine N-acyltransferase [Verrucomicrobiales bacterium]
MTTRQVAELLGGTVEGNPDLPLTGFAPAHTAKAGDLTFAENELYFAAAESSAAAAVLVGPDIPTSQKTLIRVQQPRIAFARVLPVFFPEAVPPHGIHPTAVVAASAEVAPNAHIGPHCVVGERVRIAAHCALLGGNHVGDDCLLGEDTRLFPNAVLYPRTQVGARVRIHAGAVVGSDGYGYVLDQGTHRKIPQVGFVVVQDDVEIGANTTIDRGALGATLIGRGTKIDNLVQIAHNVVTGEHCLVISQVGIAGSTRLGSYVTLAGQVGLAGHLKIGSRVTVGAQSGVMNNIPDGEKWLGSPAVHERQAKRQYIGISRLPDLARDFDRLERRLEELERRLGDPTAPSAAPGEVQP